MQVETEGLSSEFPIGCKNRICLPVRFNFTGCYRVSDNDDHDGCDNTDDDVAMMMSVLVMKLRGVDHWLSKT